MLVPHIYLESATSWEDQVWARKSLRIRKDYVVEGVHVYCIFKPNINQHRKCFVYECKYGIEISPPFGYNTIEEALHNIIPVIKGHGLMKNNPIFITERLKFYNIPNPRKRR